jgi:hypothetical protein
MQSICATKTPNHPPNKRIIFMERVEKLEVAIDHAVEQITQLVESGFSGNLLRPALRGAMKAIAVCAQKTEPYNPTTIN